jgi:putative membrane protein
MRRLVLRLLATAAALFAAIVLVDGVDLIGVAADAIPPPRTLLNLLLVAVILTLVNAIVRPILKAFTCAITFFTLGLFLFVLNALMLLLTAAIADQFDLGFVVNGFIPALLGSIVVSVVNLALSLFIPGKDD